MEIDEIKEKVKDLDIVQIFCSDLNGRTMTIQVNPENIETYFNKGVGFDGSSIPGIATVDDSDRILVPIPDTFNIMEFKKERSGFFIGKIATEDGARSKSDPRALLEKIISKAETEHGFKFLVGPEHEFFLLTEEEFSSDIRSDKAGYFQADPRDKGIFVRRRIVEVLDKCGIKFEKAHHEVADSQHEINLECVDPLRAADRTLLFKYITKKVSEEFGYHATFMPRPFNGKNRSAFHIHVSMHDAEGNNLFHDPGSPKNLSRLARQFIGGLLEHARETSLVMASTYNSYKAFMPGLEAPTYIGWGFHNRSSMVRVPFTGDPESTRIELRSPDPSGNVYLQLAVLLGAGLDGIGKNINCNAPDTGSNYHNEYNKQVWNEKILPKSLFEALVEAEKGKLLRELMGKFLYERYMALKIAEWEDHRTHITPREHEKYLSM
jgi:glutamine synthetase